MNPIIVKILIMLAIGIPAICIILYFWLKNYSPKGLEEIRPNLYATKNNKGEYSLKYPPIKDLNQPFSKSNIHWKNLIAGGKWGNLLKYLLILIAICYLMFSYKIDVDYWIENSCKTCEIQRNNEMNQLKLNGSFSLDLENKEDTLINENLIKIKDIEVS